MFKDLKAFLESNFSASKAENASQKTHTLELAAAVLMMEISLADSNIDKEERNIMQQAMQDSFHLSTEEASTIVTLAEHEVSHAISLHDFTSLLNEKLSAEDKIRIVELLWQVAFADAVIDKYEEYFVRKIADLLYVSHKDYIKAKHKASS